ncbi:MAG TPA: lysophospholipid acyltransferase family protein [Thermoanaerobaculia bacterium]
MRRAVTGLLRVLLRLFFRRIEVVGLENVPADMPVVFAANHPNGLVDPLFILCFAPRPVSFLAKAPLFRYPLIGYFVRVLDAIPVYRKQDNTKGTNAETFARAREVLRSGGSIAIFPEGTTHSDSQLRELKTGAARIALGAQLPSIAIVPAGIYYTAKQTFRSEALVWFGAPLIVAAVPVGEDGEPPPAAAIDLTAKIEKQLDSVTLQADSRAALELIARAEDIFSGGAEQPLATELELRRRFVDGFHYLRERDPARLAQLSSAVRQFSSELGGARLDPEDLTPRIDARAMLRVIILLPVAVIGAVLHFLPYKVVDFLSRRFSRDADEMTATVKFIASLLLYPIWWIAVTIVVWRMAGRTIGASMIIVLPLAGHVALRVIEQVDEFTGKLRAMVYRTRSRAAHARLVAHRQRIREQILAVADALDQSLAS